MFPVFKCNIRVILRFKEVGPSNICPIPFKFGPKDEFDEIKKMENIPLYLGISV